MLRQLITSALCLLALLQPLSTAANTSPPAPSTSATEPATLVIMNRPIHTFRGTVLGISPQDRMQRSKERIRAMRDLPGDLEIKAEAIPQGKAIYINGLPAFVVAFDDANPLFQETHDEVTARAVAALRLVIAETREGRDLRAFGMALAWSLLATLVAYLLYRVLRKLRKISVGWLYEKLTAQLARVHLGGAQLFSREHTLSGLIRLLNITYAALLLLVAYVWLGHVLAHFPYTRVWGEGLNHFLIDMLGTLGSKIIAALPDLIVAVTIFLATRMVARWATAFFERVSTGKVEVSWLEKDVAVPTRRITVALIWIFALVMAYPYLPGSHSEAFKGISVLLGLMISIGASTHIGQIVSGLILTYTRVFRLGEFVRIAEHEGTVIEIGLINTRIRTGMGEELYLPNTMVLNNVTKNYSRTVVGKGFIVDTTVTIGYDTPWRQVQAMLQEAAKRTPGVLDEPQPHVFQTALSDFYPEYRLVCQAVPSQPRPRAEVLNQLHANIQDVFNEYGVQIMSPHYLGDPATAKVVPPSAWRPAPASNTD